MNGVIASATQIKAYMFQYTEQGSQRMLSSISISSNQKTVATGDRLEIGRGGISSADAIKVLTDRVLEKIRATVEEARNALGIPSASQLDTSADATASRIFDFAMGFFDAYREKHPELDDDEAKQKFVDLVGGAIQQGIQEARDILSGIAPISDPINQKIDAIAASLNDRFNQFLNNAGPESGLGNGVPTGSIMTN
ncbi:MAG: DUF5610 domain-containing protein [Candidatus Hydrogenedentes bacterium]|nr:DUF5610 domain-containing protein [Candidatus Hydrogenedentota bacterium]